LKYLPVIQKVTKKHSFRFFTSAKLKSTKKMTKNDQQPLPVKIKLQINKILAQLRLPDGEVSSSQPSIIDN